MSEQPIVPSTVVDVSVRSPEPQPAVAQIVEAAHIAMDAPTTRHDALPASAEVGYEALRALVARTAASRLPGATSDHSDMYDENGLPI